MNLFTVFFPPFSQYGRSDSYRVATTQDKDEKESPKKKGGKDLDDLKKEVPIVSTLNFICFDFHVIAHMSFIEPHHQAEEAKFSWWLIITDTKCQSAPPAESCAFVILSAAWCNYTLCCSVVIHWALKLSSQVNSNLCWEKLDLWFLSLHQSWAILDKNKVPDFYFSDCKTQLYILQGTITITKGCWIKNRYVLKSY